MEENRKYKRKGGSGALIWIVIVLAASVLRNMDSVPIRKMLPVLAIAVGMFLLVVLLSALAGKKKPAAPAARTKEPWEAKPTPRRPAPTSAPAAVPTASEYDTERDRVRRRQQLDTFLRNGIIDQKEYALLLARHERQG